MHVNQIRPLFCSYLSLLSLLSLVAGGLWYMPVIRHFTRALFTCGPTSVTRMSTSAGIHSVAYVTAPNEEVAKKLAHGIVENKLAACVNIIPKVTSVYIWEGKVNEDAEVLMMIKTRTSRIDDLTKFVRENHPYQVCEVISLPIAAGNEPYLSWISESVPEKQA